jgi:hypothetical protein
MSAADDRTDPTALIGAVLGYDAGHGPQGNTTPPAIVDKDRDVTTWEPVDLTDYLNGADEPPPVIMGRTDGLHLLYAGKTHAFIGESESCKTWGAAMAAVEVLAAGGRVLWIDFEDDPRGLIGRLRAMGATPQTIAAQLDYLHPEAALRDRNGERFTMAGLVLGDLLRCNSYALAVVDGVTEGMATEGLDPLGTDAAAIWARRLTKPIAATGAAVVVLDHVPKGNSDGPTRYALGSQHKISGLTGAAYIFELRKTLHRTTTDPVTGEVVIKISKDRPGHVRAGAVGHDRIKTVGVLELTAYPDGGVTGRLLAPDEATTTPPARLLAAIAEHLAVYDGQSGRQIQEAVAGGTETLRAAVRWMVDNGYLTVTKSGRSHLHTLTDAGRDLLNT